MIYYRIIPLYNKIHNVLNIMYRIQEGLLMKRNQNKKRIIAINTMILMLVSAISYPIFASGLIEESEIQEDESKTQEDTTFYNEEVEYESSPISTGEVQTRAIVGETFQVNIKNNGVENLPCTFRILSVPDGEDSGTVEIGTGKSKIPSIAKETTGTIEIPNEVIYEGNIYKITTIGDYGFFETKIANTGLESNSTITTIGMGAFSMCRIISTGLENNTTVITVGDSVFEYCFNLNNVIFEITTLPSMGNNVFFGPDLNIYYPHRTINSDVLNNVGAASVQEIVFNSIQVKTPPTKINYIEEKVFDASGMVLTSSYNYGDRDIAYNDSTKDRFAFDKKELSLGNTSIIITYGGKSTEQVITVIEKTITGITVKTNPNKLEYIEEEEFNPDGLVLSISYDHGNNEDVIYNENTKSEFIFDKKIVKAEDSKVGITYNGKETTIESREERNITDTKRNIFIKE